MSVAGFFILLGIAIALRFIGNRLIPVFMPAGRFGVIALGWAGGFLGSWLDSKFWQLGPNVADINIIAAVIGCAVFILLVGITPFIKIMLGKIK